MEDGFRRLTLGFLIGVWAVYVLVNSFIFRVDIPEFLFLFPSAIIAALYPQFKLPERKRDSGNVGPD